MANRRGAATNRALPRAYAFGKPRLAKPPRQAAAAPDIPGRDQARDPFQRGDTTMPLQPTPGSSRFPHTGVAVTPQP